jgi:hypothetical protein
MCVGAEVRNITVLPSHDELVLIVNFHDVEDVLVVLSLQEARVRSQQRVAVTDGQPLCRFARFAHW